MRIWRLAFIASVAGFIYGVTSSEPPFSHLQKAALSIPRLPMSWWAPGTASCSNSVLTRHKSEVVPHLGAKDATFTVPVAPMCSETIHFGVPEEENNKPTDCKSDLGFQDGIAGVLIGENSFSIDAKNLSLSSVLEELSDKCHIEIVGKDTLVGKVISAKFDSMKVQDGIRQMLRIAGVENYALSYRTDPEDQYSVSQIVLLPADHEVPEARPIAKAGPQVDLTDHLEAQSPGNVAAEIPEEILADLRAEIQAEVPANMQAEILAEILCELRQ